MSKFQFLVVWGYCYVSMGFHFFLFALIKTPQKESICLEAQGSPHIDKLFSVLHSSDFDRVSKETGDSFYIKWVKTQNVISSACQLLFLRSMNK